MNFNFDENGMLNVGQMLNRKEDVGRVVRATINFTAWTEEEREDYYMSWDDEDYFRNLYEEDKNRVYDFKIYKDQDTSEIVAEIINEEDETCYTILALNQINIIE